MFIQSAMVRIMILLTILVTGVTGIVYGVGHLSDRPVIMAYVEQSQPNGGENLFAYLVDPIRRLNVPIELPSLLISPFYYTSPFEPYSVFVIKDATDTESNTRVRRLYRYNFLTQELTTLYQKEYDDHIPPNPSRALEFNGYSDERYYIVVDKHRHAILLVDRKTLAQQILWQGKVLPDETLDYTLRADPSPSADKYAILDSSQDSMVTIVTPTGDVLNQFRVTELSESVTNDSLLLISWMDNQYVLVTTFISSGTDAVVLIYDTARGEINPYTKSLRAANVLPVHGCQDQGQWISYTKQAEDNLYQVFTTNLATGTTYEHTSYEANNGTSGPSLLSNSNCSILLKSTPITGYLMDDVYLTTLQGENTQLLVSNVIFGTFIDEDNFTYAQINETGGFNVYTMSLDDEFTTELLLADLPTPVTHGATNVLQRGWYVFLDNHWNRTPSQFPFFSGNPLLYYDVHSRDVHVLTPPGVRIWWASEIP